MPGATVTPVEQPLPSNATIGVVRVGDTVRRPVGPATATIDALLTHLAAVGFVGAPRPLGRDERGRQVLSWMPGRTGDPQTGLPARRLGALGRLLRDLHEATAGWSPPVDAVWEQAIPPDRLEVVGHGDPGPWNIVDGPSGLVLIDWDAAGPTSVGWELAYAAQTCALGSPGGLRNLVDGYGLDKTGRRELGPLLPQRAQAMVTLLETGHRTGRQPWARIHNEDGDHWRAVTEHLRDQEATYAKALFERRVGDEDGVASHE